MECLDKRWEALEQAHLAVEGELSLVELEADLDEAVTAFYTKSRTVRMEATRSILMSSPSAGGEGMLVSSRGTQPSLPMLDLPPSEVM